MRRRCYSVRTAWALSNIVTVAVIIISGEISSDTKLISPKYAKWRARDGGDRHAGIAWAIVAVSGIDGGWFTDGGKMSIWPSRRA